MSCVVDWTVEFFGGDTIRVVAANAHEACNLAATLRPGLIPAFARETYNILEYVK